MYEKSNLDEKLIEKGEENSFNEKLNSGGKLEYPNDSKKSIKQKKYRSNLVISVKKWKIIFYIKINSIH
jgi:hypothetical protein